MPRLEDVLADLAGVPGARAAAFAGLDGLLVDEVAAARGALGPAGAVDLDGAVVELTHAWNALRRASDEHLGGGAAEEFVLAGPRGVVVARLVGAEWFAFLWAEPDVDLATARAALARAAVGLAEVVA
jgi:predicted regulator of Ras-like GTPase activity (Roadblock/LC7/MglB family)